MPLLLLALVLLTPLLAVLLMPLTLVQRYRAGTARRRARGWVAALNIGVAALSGGILLIFAAMLTVWVPRALPGALTGAALGAALGLLSLALSRWESTPQDLHVTPNRWLVLGVTLVVLARLGYGLWRGVSAWVQDAGSGSWLDQAGVPGSLAAGGLVLGYQLAFWLGVRHRLARHARLGAVVTIDHDTGRITYDR